MDLIYTAGLFVMIFMNIAMIFVGVRLLSVVFGCVTLGIVVYSLDPLISAQIPFGGWFQLLTGLVAVVCMLVVGVNGKHFGE